MNDKDMQFDVSDLLKKYREHPFKPKEPAPLKPLEKLLKAADKWERDSGIMAGIAKGHDKVVNGIWDRAVKPVGYVLPSVVIFAFFVGVLHVSPLLTFLVMFVPFPFMLGRKPK